MTHAIAETSKDRDVLVARLVAEFRAVHDGDPPYGKVVSYVDLSAVICRDVQRDARHTLESARRYILREHQMHTEPVRGVGLKLMHPDEADTIGARAIGTIRRASRRAVRRTSQATKGKILNNDTKLRIGAQAGILMAVAAASRPKAIEERMNAVNGKGMNKDQLPKSLRHLLE